MTDKKFVVALGRDRMGAGSDELGQILLKSYLYTLTELETPPSCLCFFNKGVFLSCEGSTSLDDLKVLEGRGTKIYSCGTCLNYFELTEKLEVGEKSNMGVISTCMATADSLVNL